MSEFLYVNKIININFIINQFLNEIYKYCNLQWRLGEHHFRNTTYKYYTFMEGVQLKIFKTLYIF
jgi:hypothetical protein